MNKIIETMKKQVEIEHRARLSEKEK